MPDYGPLIARVAKKYGIPENVLTALAKQESSFNPRAVSSAGAQGLTQLMPATARGLGVQDPFDPEQNLEGGAKYLRQQLDKFGRLDLALSAYNSGPGGSESRGRVEGFAETQNYVKRILGSLGGSATGGGTSLGRSLGASTGAAAPQQSRQAALAFILGEDFAPYIGSGGSVSPPKGTRGSRESQTTSEPSQGVRKAVKGFQPDFERRLAALMAAVRAEGGSLSVTSGFRSVAHQRKLWQEALKKYGSAAAARKWVAPPGRSKHGEGIAADLAGDLDLAASLAAKFGLYRPMDHEPWHFEPIGSR